MATRWSSAWATRRAERDLDATLVDAAHDVEGERRARMRDGAVEVADRVDLGAGRADDEVAAGQAGRLGGAAALDAQHEHAVALGQPDRAAHPLRDGRRRDRYAEARGDAVVGLEEAEPAAQALGELTALGVGQAGGEAGGGLLVGGAGRGDAPAPPPGGRGRRAPAGL